MAIEIKVQIGSRYSLDWTTGQKGCKMPFPALFFSV